MTRCRLPLVDYLHPMSWGDLRCFVGNRKHPLLIRAGRTLNQLCANVEAGLADIATVATGALANPDFIDRVRNGARSTPRTRPPSTPGERTATSTTPPPDAGLIVRTAVLRPQDGRAAIPGGPSCDTKAPPAINRGCSVQGGSSARDRGDDRRARPPRPAFPRRLSRWCKTYHRTGSPPRHGSLCDNTPRTHAVASVSRSLGHVCTRRDRQTIRSATE
jgi:hypothetical protein